MLLHVVVNQVFLADNNCLFDSGVRTSTNLMYPEVILTGVL